MYNDKILARVTRNQFRCQASFPAKPVSLPKPVSLRNQFPCETSFPVKPVSLPKPVSPAKPILDTEVL